MSDSEDMTDAKLAPLMEHFGERLNRVFAYFFWVLEFWEDSDLHDDPAKNPRAWRLKSIHNACLDTSLIALRDLDDYLVPRSAKTKPDDLRASDFGYKESHTFLTLSEREKINKLIAHTTTAGAVTQDFHWDMLELVTKGVSQNLFFLKWAEKKYGVRYFHLYTATFLIRSQTESSLALMTKEAEKRRARKIP